MRAVVQRVSSARVLVDREVLGSIGEGLVILLAVHQKDDHADADYLAEKIANLRIFEDKDGKMNRSVKETEGEILVVSQFTLLGDCQKGRRPSYAHAARPERALELYRHFVQNLTQMGLQVQKGRFQAKMSLQLVNEGPVTLMVESKQCS